MILIRDIKFVAFCCQLKLGQHHYIAGVLTNPCLNC